MTQKNCHTCKGVYTENQKKFYCNITGKKPNDANLLLKWYEDHEVSKPDLPCKDYAESISKQDAKHTPAGHAAHDPYGYYDNLCGFLQSWGYTKQKALYLISELKINHKYDTIHLLCDIEPVLAVYNCVTYEVSKKFIKYDRWTSSLRESNIDMKGLRDFIGYTKCKVVI
jgi:hypothetical protein